MVGQFLSSPSFFISTSLLLGSGIMFCLSLALSGGGLHHLSWNLMGGGGVEFELILLIDWTSTSFMAVVNLISGWVIFYSAEYMKDCKYLTRFTALVLAFVSSMHILILSPNIVSMLLGWDGLGLTSYLLVAFYQNPTSESASMVTVLSNRVGDVMIIIAVGGVGISGGFNYSFWFYYEEVPLVSLLTILAAFTKSAQVPFSAWLPAAMAAPTPVSSLVHSSTLVTAGVYFLIRSTMSLDSWYLSLLLILTGTITTCVGGVGGCMEFNLKKIIAYSTLSQLGIMITMIGYLEVSLSYVHLLTHALFKSLLFLGGGALITSSNNQDIRALQGILPRRPLLSWIFIFASLSLCGFPFLAGFYSKDAILNTLLTKEVNFFIMALHLMGASLTAYYSGRLWSFLFKNESSGNSALPYSPLGEMELACAAMSVATWGGCAISYLVTPPTLSPWVSGPAEGVLIPLICLASMASAVMNQNKGCKTPFMSFTTKLAYLPFLTSGLWVSKTMALSINLSELAEKTIVNSKANFLFSSYSSFSVWGGGLATHSLFPVTLSLGAILMILHQSNFT